MARREAESLISKLLQMSEEGVASFLKELKTNEGLRHKLGRAGEKLLSNKPVFDRNVESVLNFVNIPSKRDVRELKSRLDHLSGQLVNLNMKIDRMEARERKAPKPGAPRKRASKTAAPPRA
jgi:polyhydroxyalkanoate synthesis regulator phasin